MRSGRASSIVVVSTVLWLANAARADDPPLRKPKAPAALEHLSRGTKLYNVRSFEEAANEYKAGALVEPTPIFDYDLGQCYRQLGRYKDAIWHFERFLKASPDMPDHAEVVQKLIVQMKAELDKKAMTEPPTEVAPLGPTAAPSTAAAPPAALAMPVVFTRPERWYEDGVGWGLTISGLVATGAAGGLFLDASSLNSDANGSPDAQERNALHDKASTRSLIGTVVGIGGIGLLVSGVIKLAIHPTHNDAPTTAWNVGVSSNALVFFGRF